MSMMRWTPLEEMDTLKKQIDSIFTPANLGYYSEKTSGDFVPPVEILESEKAYRLRFV